MPDLNALGAVLGEADLACDGVIEGGGDDNEKFNRRGVPEVGGLAEERCIPRHVPRALQAASRTFSASFKSVGAAKQAEANKDANSMPPTVSIFILQFSRMCAMRGMIIYSIAKKINIPVGRINILSHMTTKLTRSALV